MHQILEQLSVRQVDCSESVSLLESDGHTHHDHAEHHDHEHEHEHDPHYWMDPRNLSLVTGTIAEALSAADPEHKSLYFQNAKTASEQLGTAYSQWEQDLNGVSCPYIITFHDGFHYFAEAFELHLLFSMEEEDGATASAKDILTASTYVKQYSIPAVLMNYHSLSGLSVPNISFSWFWRLKAQDQGAGKLGSW